jgi:hypothetical protein
MALTIDLIKLKRGTQSAVNAASLALGEPAIATDTRSMWVGDGSSKFKISDIVVSASHAVLPGTGEANKLYLVITDETLDNESSLYVWKAGAYVPVTTGNASIDTGDITDLDTYIDDRISNEWRGENDGLAPLDTGGKIPSSYLPDLAITSVSVVADNAARDALNVQAGDVAIVTGTNKTWIYTGSTWQEMLTAVDGVVTVNGQSGPTVTLTTSNISEGSNLYFTDARAKNAVIDDTGTTGDTDVAWSANKLELELSSHDDNLGTKEIDESNIGNGKTIIYNSTSGNLEYHTILIDGGTL